MLYTKKDEVLLSLTNTLAGNHVETEAVEKALKMICEGAAWSCGLLYEANISWKYCLSACYASHNKATWEGINILELEIQSRAIISQGGICHIVKGSHNTPLELWLMKLYDVESLILAPVLDENDHLYGLVLLLDYTSNTVLTESDKDLLYAALTTLIRYVNMRMYERKLSQAMVTMESILDNTGIDIYVNDFNTHDILYVNKSMAAPYGGQAQFMGQKCWKVLFPGQTGPCEFCPQTKLIDDDGYPTKVYTWDYQRPFDGAWFRVFSAAFKWVDGRLAHVVSSADITENKQNEALVENMANYDQLTKLPNRRMLLKECQRRIENATANEQGYLLFFDIDGFKSINDNFGHDAGDEFLIHLGEFFANIPLLKNSIYRNGGDEFVAVIGGEAVSKDNIKNLANFINDRFNNPWILKKGEVWCNTSIGVACYPDDGITVETLLQKADMAMYQVKRSGGGGVCFGYQLVDPPPILNK